MYHGECSRYEQAERGGGGGDWADGYQLQFHRRPHRRQLYPEQTSCGHRHHLWSKMGRASVKTALGMMAFFLMLAARATLQEDGEQKSQNLRQLFFLPFPNSFTMVKQPSPTTSDSTVLTVRINRNIFSLSASWRRPGGASGRRLHRQVRRRCVSHTVNQQSCGRHQRS